VRAGELMARPVSPGHRWAYVRMPRELPERAQTAAAADGRSLSDWLRRVVERALAPQDDPPTDEKTTP